MRIGFGTAVVAVILASSLAGACSGGSTATPTATSNPEGASTLPAPTPTGTSTATAEPRLQATATDTPTPTRVPPTETPSPPAGTPTPVTNILPPVGSAEFLDNLTPEGLLGRAIYEMSLVTSAHVTIASQVSGAGSALSSVADLTIDGRVAYMKQQTLGITVELLFRNDGVCIKEPDSDWEAVGAISAPASGDPRNFFSELLNGKYESLVLVPDSTADDGARVYVLEGTIATDENGNPSPVSEPPFRQGNVQIVLEWDTARVLSYRVETKAVLQGAELDYVITMTMDRHNQPPEFPAGLPQSCSTLTS